MSQSDRAIKKLATQLARLDREVKSWRGAQADYTSIENGGNFTFKDGDGNVTAIVGGQDDGSNTIRHVDGPVPPIPSGLTAHVDGPIVQVSWDGSFEDADEATYDWSHLEVVAVGPDNTNLRATINDVTGATANLAATVSGEWTVVARSVSRAEKRSLDGDAGTVEVKLVDIDGAIDAVQDSANGKNKVTYSDRPPTPADPGIFDDTWFVGQVGRPNDIVEATNLAHNPSFQSMALSLGAGSMPTRAGAVLSLSDDWASSGDTSLKISGGTSWYTSAYVAVAEGDFLAESRGKTFTAAIDFHLEAAHDDTTRTASRRLTVNVQRVGVMQYEFAASNKGGASAGTTERLSVTFTVPADAEAWNITAFNGSQSSVSYWDSFDFAEVSSPRPYFDGDTPSGATDNESHYRWTGTPHASTSEKYLPALDIGDSDNWNVIEQYRHDGTGWVKVELSHHVFSTVDLGKATVGELDGIRIMGQSIRGEQLSGDAIDGKVITGGTYRTSDGTGEWSDAGLFIARPDGTSMVRFPTDGSPLSLTASDTQIERASIGELDLSYGAVRSGGEFTLASGVTPPASPPELTTGWDMTVNLPRPSEQRMDWNGFAAWGDKWVRGVNVLGTGEGDRLEVYNADGTLNKTIPIFIDPRHDLTVIGDVCYVFGKDHAVTANDVYCFAYNLTTGARVARWQFSTNAPTQQIGVTSVGSDLLTAQVSASGNTLIVNRRNASTGLVIESSPTGTAVWDLSYTRDVQGIHWDGTDLYVAHRAATRVYTYSGSGYTRKAGSSNGTQWAGWENPNRNAGGMVFVDGVPIIVSGALYEGSTSASDYTAEVCYTWYDGTFETTPSPAATINVAARETVTISLPYREGLQKRVYTREGARWRRNTLAPETTVADIHTGVLVFGLPTTNSFPNDVPAVLKSTNDKFEVKGDGSGHWGHFNVDTNGAMSGLIVSGQTIAYVDTPDVPKKFTIQLPPGRFTKPPVVWVQSSTTVPNIVSVSVIREEITTTAFNMYFNRGGLVNTGVTWFAMDSE